MKADPAQMQEVFESLENKQEFLAVLDRVIVNLKRKRPTTHFSRENAYELLWQLTKYQVK